MAKNFGEEAGTADEQNSPISAAAKSAARNDSEGQSGRRFRTVADTVSRRGVMRGFLPKFHRTSKTGDIEAGSKRFVEKWHKKTRRLLL